MYKFKDLKATTEVEANQLPSVAINFQWQATRHRN